MPRPPVCEHREPPAWNQGSMDDHVSNSASNSSAVSQSDRAGRTQKATRTPSYLKRPSCLSMKPTVARRFSHWDNVPTLQGPHSQPSQSSLSLKCRPKSSSCFSVQPSRPMCPACQLIFKTLPLVDKPRRRQVLWDRETITLCQRPHNRGFDAFARARRLCMVVHPTTLHPPFLPFVHSRKVAIPSS